jgi:hypothetical protein
VVEPGRAKDEIITEVACAATRSLVRRIGRAGATVFHSAERRV